MFKKNSFLFGGNAIFVEEMYKQYLTNAASVDLSWRDFFADYPDSGDLSNPSWGQYPKVVGVLDQNINPQTKQISKDAQVLKASDNLPALLSLKAKMMINAYKENGHLLAILDPLGLESVKTKEHLRLAMSDFAITANDLSVKVDTDFGNITLGDLVSLLDGLYAGTVGLECTHVQETEERDWLYNRFHTRLNELPSQEEQKAVLESLIAAEGMENYIHTKFPGAKRFSVEGGEAIIAALEYAVEHFSSHGAKEIVVGMAHRGRLATLTRVIGKPYRAIFREFSGKSAFAQDLGIAGDVKYHMGYQNQRQCKSGVTIDISLLPNPSHLEAVNPVLAGSVRAKQDAIGDKSRRQIVGILIHGDAAFSGQGVVAESLAMSRLAPYDTGGLMHFVINNQVGFTANAKDTRYGRYSTDVAKISGSPIFHVNGDDPDAVIFVTKTAVEYTQKFGKDAVVEIVCYRKYGHNEGDEPMYTQPQMYEIIKKKQSAGAIYGAKLEQVGSLHEGGYNDMWQKFKLYLDEEFAVAENYVPKSHKFEGLWEGFTRSDAKKIKTSINKDVLLELGVILSTIPSEFVINSKLHKLFEQRKDDLTKDNPIDWATGEQLAFGSLLKEGVNIRLTGQDVGRGTFSHRHSVLHDQNNGNKYIPLNNIGSKAVYEVADSNLSEYGVLGFEYGYSTVNPRSLVIWEAQFGDFSNGAQIMFDQFISSSETKWMQMSGLVVLLPHGYEGQGPEHSSARLERYLQLCAEENMKVINPSTPASLFHVLRRQMLSNSRRPLIVMTPKSLLRHKLAVSKLEELAHGEFNAVIDDEVSYQKTATRIVLCTGKVYYDLVEMRSAQNIKDVAIVRIEQLYPFPEKEIVNIVGKYKLAQDIVWCQEEPKNMGAWNFVHSNLGYNKLIYVGRNDAASPAVGYLAVHHEQQIALIKEALKI